jgi:hypothetical protein
VDRTRAALEGAIVILPASAYTSAEIRVKLTETGAHHCRQFKKSFCFNETL